MDANTTTNELKPIAKRGQIVAWQVTIGAESIRVELAELPAPNYPTIHQIIHTAESKLQGIPADKVALAMAIDQAYEIALAEWDRSERLRKACCRLANLDWRKTPKIENELGRDHSRVIGFDIACQSAAYALPELGWDPSEDNGAAMWEIVSQRPAVKPKRTDSTIRQSAIDSLCQREAPAEVIPF